MYIIAEIFYMSLIYTMSLAESTLRTYRRELDRLESFGIKLGGAASLPLLRNICKTYKTHKVPFENLRLCLFALRNHYVSNKTKRTAKHEAFYSKENLEKIRAAYGQKQKEPRHNTTTIAWNDIVRKMRPFIEDESRPAADRLIAALYCLLPPRRTDYYSMKWGDQKDGNTLDPETGRMVLRDYKTRRAYGDYEFDLYEPSQFHGADEVALFRSIIGQMHPEDGAPVFMTRQGGPYSMVSFGSKVRSLLTNICRDNVTLIDIRRAFDQHIRDQILNNPRVPPNERAAFRSLIEKATSHSREMTQYYADKVDLS